MIFWRISLYVTSDRYEIDIHGRHLGSEDVSIVFGCDLHIGCQWTQRAGDNINLHYVPAYVEFGYSFS